DVAFLLSRLTQLAPTLSDEQRKAAIAQLKDAGLADQGGGPAEWPPAAAKALRTKLGMTDREKIDPARLLELATELTGFAASLDQLVWAAWKQVAPKSELKRSAMMQRMCAKFLTGDTAETSRPQLAGDIDRLRTL